MMFVLEIIAVVQSPEEEEEVKEVPYTEEELNTLTIYVKNVTTLYNLQKSDWNSQCETVIRSWFIDQSQTVMTIYFIGDELVCDTDVPIVPVKDLTYFLREPNQRFEADKIQDTLVFGTIGDHIEGSILQLVRDIYGPMLLNSENWPDSILLSIRFSEPFTNLGP